MDFKVGGGKKPNSFGTKLIMASREQLVSWSVDGSAIARDVGELDALLDKLADEHGEANPIIVIVDGPDEESVYYGVGGDSSFVSSIEEPYLTTVGSDSSASDIDYFFQGHHSPVAGKQLIPTHLARKILREFFVTGVLPSWQEWKPVGPD
jgi:Immunity protein Imm1